LCQRADQTVPIEVTVGAMAELVKYVKFALCLVNRY